MCPASSLLDVDTGPTDAHYQLSWVSESGEKTIETLFRMLSIYQQILFHSFSFHMYHAIVYTFL